MPLLRLFRCTALWLIAASLCQGVAFAAQPLDPAMVKAQIQARGPGRSVRLTEAGTTIKGTIVSIGDLSFVLKPKNSAQPVNISYNQVSAVQSGGLSTGAKVSIGVGVFLVAVIITAVLIAHRAGPNFGAH